MDIGEDGRQPKVRILLHSLFYILSLIVETVLGIEGCMEHQITMGPTNQHWHSYCIVSDVVTNDG